MGTRSRERALLDRRIAMRRATSKAPREDERWNYRDFSTGREFVDADSELRYWRQVYGCPVGGEVLKRQDFEPAVKLGLDAFLQARHRSLLDIEEDLSSRYERIRGESRLEWQQARPIVEAVWRRLTR